MQKPIHEVVFDPLFHELSQKTDQCVKALKALLLKEKLSKEDIETISKQFEYLLTLNTKIDNTTSPWYAALSVATQKKYRTQVIISSCLYFNADKILNKLAKTPEKTHDWESLCNAIQKCYSYLKTNIHENPVNEHYIVETLVGMIAEMLDRQLYLVDEEDQGECFKLLRNYNFLKQITSNLQDTLLKTQCQIYIFSVEKDEYLQFKIRKHNSTLNMKFDRHHESISSHLDEKIQSEDFLWYRKFADLTKIYNLLEELYCKIESKEDNEKIVSNCPINIKNYSAILGELVRLFEQFKIIELIEEIKKKLTSTEHFPHIFDKLLQTDDLLFLMITTINKCIRNALGILNYIIKNTIEDQNQWRTYHGSLTFKQQLLTWNIEIDSLVLKDQTERAQATNSTNKNINAIKSELNTLRKKEEETEKAFSSLVKECNKLEKQRKKRNAFCQMKLGKKNETSHLKLFEQANKDAEKFLSEQKWNQALNIYQQLLGNKNNLNILELVLTYIALGDIYKIKNQFEQSITHYNKAIKECEKTLAQEQNLEIEVQLEIARDTKKSLEENLTLLKELEESEEEKLSDKEIEKQIKNPQYRVIAAEISLPTFFYEIYNLLNPSEQRSIMVTGGTVRDYFQKVIPNDIDITIFDSNCTDDKEIALKKIQKEIQKKYPLVKCQIRGRACPILWVELDNIIIELSIKKKTAPSHSSGFKYQFLAREAHSSDATQNALFYDPEGHVVVDFFNGVDDILQNKFKLIKSPDVCFAEDPYRAFRVIRSIVKPTTGTPDFDLKIIDELKKVFVNLGQLKKDRCYTEVRKLFFRGQALATWQFLMSHNLHECLFLLPEDPDRNFRHCLMIADCLTKLDKRIQKGQIFNVGFIFTIILWGRFCEQLETNKERNRNLNASKAHELAFNFLYNSKICFYIPSDIIQQIKKIWFTYLINNNLIASKQYKHNEFKLLQLFTHLVSRAHEIAPQRKLSLTENRNGFFRVNLEFLIREIIRDKRIKYTYKNKMTTLSIDNTQILSARDRDKALLQIKRKLQLILGKTIVFYEQRDFAISFGTNHIHKKREIDALMKSLFCAQYLDFHSFRETASKTSPTQA